MIDLSPLPAVREDATLLKSLKLSVSVGETGHLAAEAVEGAALALERVDDVHGGDGLAAGVLGVGHGVTDDVLEEDLEDTAGLLVDEAEMLDTTTACEAAVAGLVMPWMLSRRTLRWRLAPPFPSPLPPFHVQTCCLCCDDGRSVRGFLYPDFFFF